MVQWPFIRPRCRLPFAIFGHNLLFLLGKLKEEIGESSQSGLVYFVAVVQLPRLGSGRHYVEWIGGGVEGKEVDMLYESDFGWFYSMRTGEHV
jgi:hypothetical protein